MTVIERKKARLDLYYAAEEAILSGAQSYTIGKRSVTKADLGKLMAERRRLWSDLAELTTGGGRTIAAWPGR